MPRYKNPDDPPKTKILKAILQLIQHHADGKPIESFLKQIANNWKTSQDEVISTLASQEAANIAKNLEQALRIATSLQTTYITFSLASNIINTHSPSALEQMKTLAKLLSTTKYTDELKPKQPVEQSLEDILSSLNDNEN